MNNNQMRKFKVGSLYRNNVCPDALYLCIGDAEWLDNGKIKYSNKSLVVLEDELGNQCRGHIVASDAMKNWRWRKV